MDTPAAAEALVMSSYNHAYRDGGHNQKASSALESALLPNQNGLVAAGAVGVGPAAAMRRPQRAAVGVQRRRVIKKHIQQKYLLCGFAIHAFLATPAYLYGNVIELDKDMILRIWPPIVYMATGELCRSILEHLDTEYRGRSRETNAFRKFFLLATLLTCVAVMLSGFLFSSAWIPVSSSTQTVAITLYGFFGGIGSSLFIWKTHVILEAVRPREDKFVRKTIFLCGEAFCQLFLSFVFISLRSLYGTAQSIMLMSALLVNLIPISLIITRHHEGCITKRISVIKAESSSFTPLHHQLGRYSSSFADQIDGIELQLQRTWKNPMIDHQQTAAALVAEGHSNYSILAEEAYVTFVNPNGVEIMEIIPEEDENISVMRSSSATIENYGRNSVSASQNMNRSHSNIGAHAEDYSGNLHKIQRLSRDVTSHIWLNMLNKIARPLRKALLVPQLYPLTLLLSADIFSYVMCLTVLPGLAFNRHAIKIAEIPFLFSLLAFPWMCFSLMTPRFGSSLYKRKFQWHTLGCLCKGLALIFISFSTSKLLLSVCSVLLGFGQAVTLFLQDQVFQTAMPRSRWQAIRHSVHFTNGLLMLVWGSVAQMVVLKFSYHASVLFAGCLYAGAILLWNLLVNCCFHGE